MEQNGRKRVKWTKKSNMREWYISDLKFSDIQQQHFQHPSLSGVLDESQTYIEGYNIKVTLIDH